MGYAVISDQPFITTKDLSVKKKLSPEARARREFFNSHRVYFETDPSTGKVQLKAEKIEK